MRTFAANINVLAIIIILLFLAIKKYNLKMRFDFVDLFANFIRKKMANAIVK